MPPREVIVSSAQQNPLHREADAGLSSRVCRTRSAR